MLKGSLSYLIDKRERKRKEAGNRGYIVANQVDVSRVEETREAKSRKVEAAEMKEIRRAPITRKSRAVLHIAFTAENHYAKSKRRPGAWTWANVAL